MLPQVITQPSVAEPYPRKLKSCKQGSSLEEMQTMFCSPAVSRMGNRAQGRAGGEP